MICSWRVYTADVNTNREEAEDAFCVLREAG